MESHWPISWLHKVNKGVQHEHYHVLIIQLMPASARVLSILQGELGGTYTVTHLTLKLGRLDKYKTAELM